VDSDCYGNGYCHQRKCKCWNDYGYKPDCSIFGFSKVLITTGKNHDGYERTSEILDLSIKGGNQCNDWAEFPKNSEYATVGLIGDVVLICGGSFHDGQSWIKSDECYSLNGPTATLVTHMSVKRTQAASLVLNETTLWITGGYHTYAFASSEYIRMNENMPGPALPIAISGHTLVAISSTFSLIIGGYSEGVTLSSTYLYNHVGGLWIDGPNLMQARQFHAAGIVTDEATKEELVLVTGGYFNGIGLDSIEIFLDGEWSPGPQLPLKLEAHSMVPLGNGQAIIGGYSLTNLQSKIYSLTCTNRNCKIELMSTELSVPKDRFVAIPIPDRISGCIMGGNNH